MTGNTIYNHSKQMSFQAIQAIKMPIFDMLSPMGILETNLVYLFLMIIVLISRQTLTAQQLSHHFLQ